MSVSFEKVVPLLETTAGAQPDNGRGAIPSLTSAAFFATVLGAFGCTDAVEACHGIRSARPKLPRAMMERSAQLCG